MFEVVASVPLEAWNVLCQMAPYLLFGFAMAGVLAVLISPATVERHLGGNGLAPVVKASLFGVPLPLCSCSVIPVAASLRKHGASRGATTAFLLSTPQTGVDSILVTWGLLGPVFAVFRPIAAFVSGLIGGGLVAVFDRDDADAERPACQDVCCASDARKGRAGAAARFAFYTLPRDIGKPLMLGILAAGAISAVIPDDFFAGAIGTGFAGMVAMMLLGLPLYVCATASVPIAAALMAKGVSAGAALAFLMTGPATNAATIVTVWRIMGRRTAMLYLGSVAGCALFFGAALNAVYTATGTGSAPHVHDMGPGYFEIACAIFLLGILAAAFVPRAKAPVAPRAGEEPPEQATLAVTGMTCGHCADSIQRALTACAGVSSAHVDLGSGKVLVQGRKLDAGILARAVKSAGYEAQALEQTRGEKGES